MTVHDKEHNSSIEYRKALKSIFLVGGSSLVNMVSGLLKAKVIAILFGPSGVGILALYSQIMSFAVTLAGMGVATSGVRSISVAMNNEAPEQLSRARVIVISTTVVSGVVGAISLVLLNERISAFTFKSANYSSDIMILGVGVLFGVATAGYTCVLQGTRHILELTKVSLLSAVFNIALSIPCYLMLGQHGIAVALAVSTIPGFFLARRYSNGIGVEATGLRMSCSVFFKESKQLVSLGLGFMLAVLLSIIADYTIRYIITQKFGLDFAGIYHSAIVLSGIFIGFILGAMGTDYLPRLVGSTDDMEGLVRIVNEQSRLSLILALPVLAVMASASSFAIEIAYSSQFNAAIPILQWSLLGIFFKVFSWPLSYLMIAKGKSRIFFLSELFGHVTHVVLVYVLTSYYGVVGAGMAFVGLYFVYGALVYKVTFSLFGSVLTKKTVFLYVLSFFVLLALLINNSMENEPVLRWTINITIICITAYVSVRAVLMGGNLRIFSPRSSIAP